MTGITREPDRTVEIGTTKVAEIVGRPDLKQQFNSIFTVTLARDKRNDLFSPSNGFLHSGSVEEARLIPSVFGGLFGSRIRYSKYIKIFGVGQWDGDFGTGRLLG